jgi:hypothetical protein
MTMNNTTARNFDAEVNDADLLAAVAELDQLDSTTPSDADQAAAAAGRQGQDQQQAQAQADDLDSRVSKLLDERLSTAVEAKLGALQQQIDRIGQAINQKNGDVPPAVLQALEVVAKKIRQIELDNIIDPDEKVRFLEEERQAEEAAREDAARREQEERDRQAQMGAQQSDYEAEVDRRNWSHFNDVVLKRARILAANYGIDTEVADEDAKNTVIVPTTNEYGWKSGYNWTQFEKDLEAKWSAQADRRDNGRRESRAAGDSGRAAQAAPGQFDPWDAKYHTNGGSVADMVEQAVRVGKF